MSKYISDIAFTPSVKQWQEKLGSRKSYERMAVNRDWQQKITPDFEAFIAQRDSFYLATSNSEGQPYIQHRGGPKGFLKVIDKETLGFADYSGNRQYITAGNLDENQKVHLFLMDYLNRTRIKVWGEAQVIEGDAELLYSLSNPDYQAKPERVILIKLKAWDVNCPQHITPRYTQEDIQPYIDQLQKRIEELEAKLEKVGVV